LVSGSKMMTVFPHLYVLVESLFFGSRDDSARITMPLHMDLAGFPSSWKISIAS